MRYWNNHNFMWRCFLDTHGRLVNFFLHESQYLRHKWNNVDYHILMICLTLHSSKIRNATSHISRRCNNLIRIEGGGGNNVCRITSKWRPEILTEIEYLGFHHHNEVQTVFGHFRFFLYISYKTTVFKILSWSQFMSDFGN